MTTPPQDSDENSDDDKRQRVPPNRRTWDLIRAAAHDRLRDESLANLHAAQRQFEELRSQLEAADRKADIEARQEEETRWDKEPPEATGSARVPRSRTRVAKLERKLADAGQNVAEKATTRATVSDAAAKKAERKAWISIGIAIASLLLTGLAALPPFVDMLNGDQPTKVIVEYERP